MLAKTLTIIKPRQALLTKSVALFPAINGFLPTLKVLFEKRKSEPLSGLLNSRRNWDLIL
jgi:hypothetical protein